MNPPDQTKLGLQVDSISKYLSLLFKLSTLLGAFCFVLYCYRLNYFPTGVTIGDSLLFIIFAASFSLVYGFIIISLLSLGICVFYLLNPINKWIHRHIKEYKLRKTGVEIPAPIQFIKPELPHYFLALFGIYFILLMYELEPFVCLNLIATTFFLSVLWAAYHDNRLKPINFIQSNNELSDSQREENIKKTKMLFLTFIIFIPLLIGGISGRILDAGMKFSNLNIGESTVLIKPPYDKAIPAIYKDTQPIYTEDGYTSFKNLKVKLLGIGQKTVIEFSIPKEKKPQTLAIPNDRIIVLPPTPKE